MGVRRVGLLAVAALGVTALASAQEGQGVTRAARAPGLRANLNTTRSEVRGGFVLPDVTGLVKALRAGPAPGEEVVTRVVVTLDSAGVASTGAADKDAPWRGMVLPKEIDAPHPLLDSLNEVRVKVLLRDGDDRPVRTTGKGVRVVLKIGDTVYPSFQALGVAVRAFRADAPMIFDARGGVPSRHAISALAVLLDAGYAPTIGVAGADGETGPDMTQVSGALALATGIAAKGPDGLPVVGLRLRADARCTWRDVQADEDPRRRPADLGRRGTTRQLLLLALRDPGPAPDGGRALASVERVAQGRAAAQAAHPRLRRGFVGPGGRVVPGGRPRLRHRAERADPGDLLPLPPASVSCRALPTASCSCAGPSAASVRTARPGPCLPPRRRRLPRRSRSPKGRGWRC